jgi:Zn/Cd-binding protein ZinT
LANFIPIARGVIIKKNIMPSIRGLTTFPKNIPSRYQALLRGSNRFGLDQAISAKALPRPAKAIEDVRCLLRKKYKQQAKKMTEKKKPNF